MYEIVLIRSNLIIGVKKTQNLIQIVKENISSFQYLRFLMQGMLTFIKLHIVIEYYHFANQIMDFARYSL